MKRLGFGLMRLPVVDKDNPTSFNYELIDKMFAQFMERGFNFFDTAYVYHNKMSETVINDCLVKQFPREDFKVSTKLPLSALTSKKHQEQVWAEQLEKTGAGYFDYYLLHNIRESTYKIAMELESFAFGYGKKAQGLIKNFGFSFHGSPELLDEVLTAQPNIDFVLLQINYLDWENPSIKSRRCYEVARSHNKNVLVMEPLKGGCLADPPDEIKTLFKEANPDVSFASWGIRFVASLDGVIMVLSGMNSMEQITDNTETMSDFQPLDEQERKVIQKAVDIFNNHFEIPCTSCGYCLEGCPNTIAIPDYFALYNSHKSMGSPDFSINMMYYNDLIAKRKKPSDCAECGLCNTSCPQNIDIIAALKKVKNLFE